MRYSPYLYVFIAVLSVVTACGKQPRDPSTPPNADSYTIELPDEAKPRCASIELAEVEKNAPMLQGTWLALNQQLNRFGVDARALNTSATTYCNSKTDANYNKLTRAYETAYLSFKGIYPYQLFEYKRIRNYFETPFPLAIDSALADPLPIKNEMRFSENNKISGFPVVDYLIFHNKSKLQDAHSKYCDLLLLNTGLIEEGAIELSRDMSSRYNKAATGKDGAKKMYLVEIAEKMRDSLKEISSQQKMILSDPTKINQLDSRYSKKSLLGIEAAVQSIHSIYKAPGSVQTNFERRLCSQDYVAYRNEYLDASAKIAEEPTKRLYPFFKKRNGQIVYDDFRRVQLLINEIKKETTLEEGYPNASTHPELKKKLRALNEQLNKLSNDLDILFAKAISLVRDKAGDADND